MQNSIKYFNQQDRYLFHAFKSCGVLTKEYVCQYISNHRLNLFMKEGYIKVAICFSEVKKCTEYVFFLTLKGKRFAKKYCISGEFYRSSSSIHDLAVAKQYMSLSLEQRLTWQTEKELLNVLNQTLLSYEEKELWEKAEGLQNLIQSEDISPCDGGYLLDEKLRLVEIVTTNYTFENILAKYLFAEALGCPLDIIKI
ncbi:hypothetical protein [Lysinibacillus boronitolerans]|uniref:hypothetical protein n=1 Tax=Lysinibacillus boronitolerans TaxID=309788 RepID=UPI0038524B73